ncbi:hypothetical protein R6U77_09985 [Lysinibacillus louembei]|uniref:Phage protein n=1 Tax=Lysinibacillus louembei TaxID=1470088 RepID=A0ABZ0RTT4_9BACI|nr:hypothetical protein [Lysinibacillus louembei]WPK10265.1 hypothetical protein R6U77_09985 [Lysinibacillus louembei]
MKTIINTTNYGLHELHARYDAKYKVATFDKYTVYTTRPPFKMGQIELTKEDVLTMLHYFEEVEQGETTHI